jgi:hypothetical protein
MILYSKPSGFFIIVKNFFRVIKNFHPGIHTFFLTNIFSNKSRNSAYMIRKFYPLSRCDIFFENGNRGFILHKTYQKLSHYHNPLSSTSSET